MRSFFIYIPFWLNLYKIAQDLPDAPDRIYIPFWLNLYAAEGEIIVKDDLFTFHSG